MQGCPNIGYSDEMGFDSIEFVFFFTDVCLTIWIANAVAKEVLLLVLKAKEIIFFITI